MANLIEPGRGRLRSYLGLFALSLTFAITMATLPPGLTGRAVAQDDEMKEAGDEPAEGTEEAPAGDAAAPAAAPQSAAQKSYLMWMIEASGPFGALIAIESFVLVALIAMNIMNFRRENFLPPAFIEAFEQKLQQKDYQGAYELAKADDSYIGKVLTGGMARLSKGYEEAVAGMQEAGDEESMNLDHKLSYIGLIVTTAPMLGLLGTVQGMIASFRVIATSDTSPKPKDLAEGIATALFTTLEGLVVAIPAIFAFGLFKNKIARLTFEVGQVSETLMSRFATLGKRPAAAAPAAAPGGAAPAAPTA